MPPRAGTAYIDIEPRLDGLKRELSRKITPVARRAGRDLGQEVGRDASRGLDRLARSASHAEREVAPLGRRLRGVGTGIGRETQGDITRLGQAADRADDKVAPLGRRLRGLGGGIGRRTETDLNRTARSAAGADRNFRQMRIGARLGAGSVALLGRGAGVAAGFLGVAGLGGAIGFMARETADAQVENAKLTGVMNSMGKEAPATRKRIEELTNSISRQTGEDDELVKSSLTVLATFKNVRNRVGADNQIYDRTAKSLKGISLIFGQDMPKAATMMGKALQDPEKGAGALRRIGAISQADVEKIKEMAEKGAKPLELQRFLLTGVEKQVGKVSREYGRSLPASVGRAKVAFGDLAEEHGNKLAPSVDRGVRSVTRFVGQMQRGEGAGGRFRDRVEEIGSGFVSVGRPILRVVGAVAKFTAQHPGLLKVAGAIAAIGLAIRALRFTAAISGLTQITRLAAPLAAAGGAAPVAAAAAGAGGAAGGRRFQPPPGSASTATAAAMVPGERDAKSGRVRGRISGFFRGVAPYARTAGAVALGTAAISGLYTAFDDRGRRRTFGQKVGDFFAGAGIGRSTDQRMSSMARRVAGSLAGGRSQVVDTAGLSDREIGRAAARAQQRAKGRKVLVGIGFDNRAFTREERGMLQRLGRMQALAQRAVGRPVRLRLDVNPRRQERDLRAVAANFDFLRKASHISMRDLLRTTSDSFRRIKRTMDVNSAGGRKAVTDNFRLGLRHIKGAMESGEISTRQGMGAIRRLMRQHSGGGKEALKENMFEVRRILAQTMDRGVSITEKGAGRIRRIFAQELKAYGFSKGEIGIYLKGKDPKGGNEGGIGMPQRATGGYVGWPGEGGRDKVHAVLGKGEAVLNRHQQPVVNRALQAQGIGGLPDLFKRVAKPHYLAAGGFAGMVGAANRLERAHFPYVLGGGHSGTPAPFGPMDCSGAVSYVLQQGGVRIPTMVSGALASAGQPGPGKVTVFADAGHTLMRLGRRFFGTSTTNPGGGAGWIDPAPSPGYLARFNVRHFDAAGGGGGLGSVPRQVVGGPRSALQALSQRVLDRTRSAANRRLDAVATAPIGAGDAEVAGGQYGKAELRRLWIQAGGPRHMANTMAAIALAESGGDPRARNASGASGLWQIHPPQAGWENPLENARMAVGKYRGQGFGAWTVYTSGAYRRYLSRGGLLADAARGLLVGGRRLGTVPSAAEIRKQTGRVGRLEDRLDRKGIKKKDEKRLRRDLDRARRQLSGMKRQRRKGLGRRTRSQGRLADRVKGFQFPEALVKGLTGHERGIEDLGSLYDQFEADYRVDDVLTQGELDDLVARKVSIRNLVGGDPLGTGGTIQWVRDALVPLVEKKIEGVTGFIERLKARVRANLKAIQRREREAEKIRRRIKAVDRQIGEIQRKRKKTDGDKRRLAQLHNDRDGLNHKLAIITQREIPALEADNRIVTGEKRPKTLAGGQSQGEGFLLPDARTVLGLTDDTAGPSLRGFKAEFLEKLRPGALQSDWKAHDVAIRALLREGATKPEGPVDDSTKEALATLLKEHLAESRLRLAVSEAHFGQLRGLPFAGIFHTGGVVPGPVGQERVAVVQGGERISPADSAPADDLRVIIEDHRVRVFRGDEEIRAVVRDETRKMSHPGHRPLPGLRS